MKIVYIFEFYKINISILVDFIAICESVAYRYFVSVLNNAHPINIYEIQKTVHQQFRCLLELLEVIYIIRFGRGQYLKTLRTEVMLIHIQRFYVNNFVMLYTYIILSFLRSLKQKCLL